MADGEGFNAYEYQREEAEIREAEMQRDHDDMASDNGIDREWLDECRRAWQGESTAEDLRQQAERDRRYQAWETRRAELVAGGLAKMVAMREALRA